MTRQIDSETAFLGASVGVHYLDLAKVAPYLRTDDFERPANVAVWEAIVAAVTEAADAYSESVVLDVLVRRGANSEKRKALLDAITAGSATNVGALRLYAAAMVSARLRRQIECVGHALLTASTDSAERGLVGQVEAAVTAIKATEGRLIALRGDHR
jgi:replicative DNA helicase